VWRDNAARNYLIANLPLANEKVEEGWIGFGFFDVELAITGRRSISQIRISKVPVRLGLKLETNTKSMKLKNKLSVSDILDFEIVSYFVFRVSHFN
jgi:hypothetical protein